MVAKISLQQVVQGSDAPGLQRKRHGAGVDSLDRTLEFFEGCEHCRKTWKVDGVIASARDAAGVAVMVALVDRKIRGRRYRIGDGVAIWLEIVEDWQ